MDARELPARPSLEPYERLANDLLNAYSAGDPEALRRIGDHFQLERPPTHEQFLSHVQQSLRRLPGAEARIANVDRAVAQFIVAVTYGFDGWPALVGHIDAVNLEGSHVLAFESAVDALVAGDLETLASLLRGNPELVRARSTRKHHSTLLHYAGANGVEDFRQKTPKNAVQVAEMLIEAGADVDAPAAMYGGGSTTLGLVATSIHPFLAGVQNALIQILLDHGAAIDTGGRGAVLDCLANGRGEAADYLANRGARLDLEGAAGLGRLELVKTFFDEDGRLKPTATRAQMKDGFEWACQYGHIAVVEFLLQKGVDVDGRLKQHGQTALHWAAYGAHLAIVKLLLDRHARVDIRDGNFGGTPLGWALYAWGESPPDANRDRYYEVVALLVAAGSHVDLEWLADPDRGMPLVENLRADPRMRAALRWPA